MHAQDPKDRFTESFVGDATTAPVVNRSSSDLTAFTACSLLAYAVAFFLPDHLDIQVGPIEKPTNIAVAIICSVIFAVGFQFASRWSSSKGHAVQAYRVSFGLASMLCSAYLFNTSPAQACTVLCTTTLGFSLFEMCHLWSLESLGAYFKVVLVGLIALWSLVLDGASGKTAIVEYNSCVLLILTVGSILAATDAIASQLTIGTYMVPSTTTNLPTN